MTVTRIALETEGESKSGPRDYLRFPSKRSAKQRLASARLDSGEEAKYTRRDERKLNSQSHGGKREAPLRPPPTPNHPSLYRNQCAKEGKGPGHESDLDSSEQRIVPSSSFPRGSFVRANDSVVARPPTPLPSLHSRLRLPRAFSFESLGYRLLPSIMTTHPYVSSIVRHGGFFRSFLHRLRTRWRFPR